MGSLGFGSFTNDNLLLNGIIDFLMNEFSIAAAVFSNDKRMIASTAVWKNENENPTVKSLVDEALSFFHEYGNENSTTKNFTSESKTLVCFPVLASSDEQAAIFLIKDSEDNRSKSILKVYHDIFENFEEGYFELDNKGNITYCNERIAEITGIPREELYGLNYRAYTTQNTADQLFAVYSEIFRTSKPSKISDFEVIKRDGTTAVFEVSSGLLKDDLGIPIGFRGICRDASDRIKAETEKRILSEQLQQAQRFEAVATMAGGIAHDFNNLLMSIQGYLSLLQLGTDPNSKNFEYLMRIEEHIEKGAALTKQMLGFSFSDLGFTSLGKNDINDLVKRTSSVLAHDKANIDIILELSKSDCYANCDSAQIEKVLTNLCINSCQSMPEGGKLTLSTENVTCNEDIVSIFKTRPGRYVRLSVTDTGLGMDEITKRRIFNPFFTTSHTGQSSGLGLTTAFGIIKNHGGFITINSELGCGTSVGVYLPASA